MKKVTKILVLCLSVCLLVGALALIVSANTGSPDTKTFESTKPFVVPGTTGADSLGGYDTFEAAAAQANGKVIYLNADWTVSETVDSTATVRQTLETGTNALSIIKNDTNAYIHTFTQLSGVSAGVAIPSGDITLNLNGYSVKQDFTGILFRMYGDTFTITGSGSFDNITSLISVEAYSKLFIDATGEIVINNTEGRYAIFTMQNRASEIKVTGKLTINPAQEATTVFDLRTVNTQDDATNSLTHNLIFDTAVIKVNTPPKELVEEGSTATVYAAANELVRFGTGANIEVKNSSRLEMAFGRLFTSEAKTNFNYPNATPTYLSLLGYLGNDMNPVVEPTATPDLKYGTLARTQYSKVTARDSALILNDEMFISHVNQNIGSIFADHATSHAIVDIQDCELQSNGTAFYGIYDAYSRANNNGAGYKAAWHQITVTDSDLKIRSTNGNPGAGALSAWGVNLKWSGGTIDLGDKIQLCQQCIAYNEVTGGFVGMLLDEVKIKSTHWDTIKNNLSELTATALSSYTGIYYRFNGTIAQNVDAIVDGQKLTYKAVISADSANQTSVDTSYISKFEAGDGKADFESQNGVSTNLSQTLSWTEFASLYNNTVGDMTRFSEELDEYGNEYFNIAFSKNTRRDFDFSIGNSSALNVLNTKYLVAEFDIASMREDAWLTGAAENSYFQIHTITRYGLPRYAADGSYLGTQSGGNSGSTTAQIYKDGTLKLQARAWESFNNVAKLPAGGEWSRFTFVYEMYLGEEAQINLPAYTLSGSTYSAVAGTATSVPVNCVQVICNAYIYVDGMLVGYAENIYGHTKCFYNKDGGTDYSYLPKDYLSSAAPYIDCLRFTNAAANLANGDGYGIDNVRVLAFANDKYQDLDLGLVKNGTRVEDLSSNHYINKMPVNKNSTMAKMGVGTVDGVRYYDETLFAAAIKAGSHVEIFKDITKPIKLPGDIVLVRNGHSVSFISETYKVKEYTGIDVYKATLAEADEIKSVIFKESEEVSTTVNAPIGTLVNAPAPIVDKTASNWYKLVSHWNEDTIAAINASDEIKEYTVELTAPIKEAWVNIKTNITLYSFYQVNFYLPALDADISNVSITTTPDGTIKAINTATAEGTLNGNNVVRYTQNYGLSDTAILTYYVKYNIGNDEYTYSFDYGIPKYIYTVVKASEDTDTQAFLMNMVNYTDKLLTKLGTVDKETDLGAKIYSLMLANQNYGALVTKYEDKEFTEGKIYTNEIATLKASTNVLPDTEIKVIEDYTMFYNAFFPRFIFKISDAAAQKGGVSYNGSWPGSTYGLSLQMNTQYGAPLPMNLEVTDNGVDPNGNWDSQEYKNKLTAATNTASVNCTTTADYDYYYHLSSQNYRKYLMDGADATNPVLPGSGYIDFVLRDLAYPVDITIQYNNAEAGHYYMSLAGYINKLLTVEGTVDTNEVELAKALYAFAKSADSFYKENKN